MPIDYGGHTATGCESGPGVQSIRDMRVFISYAHEDYETALNIRNYLDDLGAHVLWDRSFALGSGFHEQIKTQIAYAHVFMPIITPSSSARGWVHQEIGYAMAMNVPVLPVALKELPDAMIGPLDAVMLRDDDDIDRLGEHLKGIPTNRAHPHLPRQHGQPVNRHTPRAYRAQEGLPRARVHVARNQGDRRYVRDARRTLGEDRTVSAIR